MVAANLCRCWVGSWISVHHTEFLMECPLASNSTKLKAVSSADSSVWLSNRFTSSLCDLSQDSGLNLPDSWQTLLGVNKFSQDSRLYLVSDKFPQDFRVYCVLELEIGFRHTLALVARSVLFWCSITYGSSLGRNGLPAGYEISPFTGWLSHVKFFRWFYGYFCSGHRRPALCAQWLLITRFRVTGVSTESLFAVYSSDLSWSPLRYNQYYYVRHPGSLPRWLTKKSATKTELQSLVGKLAFVCKCICPGHLFLSRISETLHYLRWNHHRIKLSAEFRRDIRWWLHFLGIYNGVSLIPSQLWSAPDSVFSTDAC